jgi:hypothetical protein
VKSVSAVLAALALLAGPLAEARHASRGDAGVVTAHLAALPPEVAAVYRPLSRRGLRLVGHRLPPEARAALEKLLASENL